MSKALARLHEPRSLVLIAINTVPLVGILLWSWDAFLLLVLYWLETVVLGFWVMAAVMLSPRTVMAPLSGMTSRIATVAFLLVHSGVFMSVHFMILWELLAGSWAPRIHGPGDFFGSIVIGQGLWLPLAILFVIRGVEVLLTTFEPKWAVTVLPVMSSDGTYPVTGPLFGFYVRIFIMQFTLVLGGVIASLIGASIALVLLVVLKTAFDLGMIFNMDERAAAHTACKSAG